MPVELKVPEVGESITEVHIAQWRKRVGESAQKDENLVEIESDKATVELPSPIAGTITQILKQSGEKAKVGEVIGYIDGKVSAGEGKPAAIPSSGSSSPAKPQAAEGRVMPAAERVMAQENLRASDVTPTGPGGRMLKEDAQRAAQEKSRAAVSSTSASAAPKTAPPALRAELMPAEVVRPTPQLPAAIDTGYPRDEEHVVMSPIRARIAQRLVEAQQTAALLTTFNEVDMGEVMDLRGKFKDAFEKKHGVKLGFMSFFVKAVIDALRQFPQLNAEVREPHIVYRSYYDIGIAVGGGKGLVVPVLRNAEFMSFAEIEQKIADYGRRAQENKLKLDELQGGTFTISNGGVYGSLLSTPIINPPQSGILGLHAIQDRPVAKNGQVVIRPMMYLALTYDHRIVDGREAVQFLKRIKDVLEDPSRMLIEI